MREKRQRLEEQFYQTLTSQIQTDPYEPPRIEEFYYTNNSSGALGYAEVDENGSTLRMPSQEKIPILAKMINKSMPHKYTLMRQMLED